MAHRDRLEDLGRLSVLIDHTLTMKLFDNIMSMDADQFAAFMEADANITPTSHELLLALWNEIDGVSQALQGMKDIAEARDEVSESDELNRDYSDYHLPKRRFSDTM